MDLFCACQHGTRPMDRAIQLISTKVGHARRAPVPTDNHIFLVKVEGEGPFLTREGIESVLWRTRRFDATEKRGQSVTYWRITDATPDQLRLVWQTAESFVGTWYDVWAIVHALYWCALDKPFHWVDDPRHGVDCAENVALAIRSAALPFCGERPAASLTPALGATHCVDYWEWVPEDEVLG